MKLVPLSNCNYLQAKVDDEDYDLIMAHNRLWTRVKSGAVARSMLRKSLTEFGKGRKVAMHRLVLDLWNDDGRDVDHIDGDNLNNQKSNLRIVTHSQNLHNTGKMVRGILTSKYKGVSWHKKAGKWQVYLCVKGHRIYGGLFTDEICAARKANELMLQHIKEFCQLNVV